MKDQILLLDSNVYFRFARSIHPFLPGDYIYKGIKYLLSVIDGLQGEFDKSPRLQSKFHWVNTEKFKKNRQANIFCIKPQDESDVEVTISYIKANRIFGASPVDIRALAVAEIEEIPLVTDDLDMLKVAHDLDIQIMETLDLMELIVNSGRYDVEKMVEIVEYWKYEDDLPYIDFEKDFKDEFLLDFQA